MTRSLFFIAVLLLAMGDHPTVAQNPLPNNPLDQNAALSYWQAFALLPQIEEDVRKRLSSAAGGGAAVDDAMLELVDSSEVALRYLHRGARIESCGWGIAYDAGPHAYLPHLSKARDLARIALLRARIRFEAGRADEGMDDVLAAVQLGRHAGQEGVVVLINVLVGFAIESQAGETIAHSMHRLDQAQRDELQRRLLQIKPPLDLKQSLRGEKDVFLGWLVREIDQGRSKDAILELVSGNVDAELAERVRNASQAELRQWAKELNAVYDTGAGFMSLPPAAAMEQEKKLAAQLRDDSTGNPLGALFLPSFGAARRAEAQFLTRQALLKAAFAVFRDGHSALQRGEHHDPFGDGPFKLERIEGGVELVSDLQAGNEAIKLRIPGLE